MSVKRINSFTICNYIVKIFLFENKIYWKVYFLTTKSCGKGGLSGQWEGGEREKGTKMQPNLGGSTVICHKTLSVWVIWN